jgi:predicted DNA-binding ArsR family transcriptional regulator
MAEKSYEREFGEVQTKLKHLTDNQNEIIVVSKEHRAEVDRKLEKISVTLDGIESRFDQVSGAWKATTLIAAVAGVAASLLVSIGKILLAIPLR